ncbi:unnamed protein product [Hymenolepis diminuta]|uniref:Uncharacterized protein n=1 Tax=Hymenolepis diminuta TaxID=6216 RepID=A0A564Y486_HYMDI|nr:unnamed protein product [Hymenolepis diminuta]
MERTNEGRRGRANHCDPFREREGEKARIGERARIPPSGLHVTALGPRFPTLLSSSPTSAPLPLNRTFPNPNLLYPWCLINVSWN